MKFSSSILVILFCSLASHFANASWQTVTTSILDINITTNMESYKNTLYASGFTFRKDDVATWVLAASQDGGLNWQELDRYRSGGIVARPFIYVSHDGDIYESAEGLTDNGGGRVNTSWVIRKKEKNQTNFKIVDNFLSATSLSTTSSASWDCGPSAMAEDRNGVLYIIGTTLKEGTGEVAVVRSSTDSGKSWKTLSSLPTVNCIFPTMQMGLHDEIWASQTCDIWNTQQVEISRSNDLGVSWNKIDAPTLTGLGAQVPSVSSFLFLPDDDVIYGGSLRDWTIRKMDHLTNSWTTVSQITSPHQHYIDEFNSLFAERGSKKIWAAGSLDEIWTVKFSTDDGTTWQDSDSFQPASKALSEPDSILQDELGNIYVYGNVGRKAAYLRKLAK